MSNKEPSWEQLVNAPQKKEEPKERKEVNISCGCVYLEEVFAEKEIIPIFNKMSNRKRWKCSVCLKIIKMELKS